MARSKSSGRWLKEHFSDVYVKRAQHEGFRARSVYKLIEMQERYKIITPHMTIVDLGAAPGSWSEFVVRMIKPPGRVVALDILSMRSIFGVEFIQGDFTDTKVVTALIQKLGGKSVDVVLSDMAPNLSGISIVDAARAIGLVESALYFAKQVLKINGTFLVKIFQGEGFDGILRELRKNFKSVNVIKPSASRSRSKEVFILARGYFEL